MAHQWVAERSKKKRQHRVLVVDDDSPTCILCREILQRAGYKVSTFVQPDDALLTVERGERFDLAIVDVLMPAMSGDECARRLRTFSADLPILFLTGYPDALFRARPVLWEGEAFLEKPCTEHSLLEAVSLLLHGTTGDATERTSRATIISRTKSEDPPEPAR